MLNEHITIKTPVEIETMRRAARLAARTLDLAGRLVKPGVTTEEINEFVHTHTLENGAIPAPLNYRGFPKSVCTSVNDVVCHGIPSPKCVLREGDIVNIDVTSIVDGFHGDTSRTFPVGQVSEEALRLIRDTETAMMLGIGQVRPGARVRDIGAAIQDFVDPLGYGLVRDYVGHGIGRGFHEPPNIFHYRTHDQTVRFRPGMAFTVEPMLNLGTHETVMDKEDGWTVYTLDGSLSAQFEHTVVVTENGYEILTLPAW